MKLVILFVAILSVIIKFSSLFIHAKDVSIFAADPATTDKGGAYSLYSCDKDKAEEFAYCSGNLNHAVKLGLNPIIMAAEIQTPTCTSSIVYESGSTSIAFFGSNRALKYTPTSPFTELSDVLNPDGVEIYWWLKFVADEANQVVYVSDAFDGAGKIYKITSLDSTPTIASASTPISLSGTGDRYPIDMILADADDLYVAFSMNPGRVARVAGLSSSSPAYTKTVTLSEGEILPYPCLTKTDNNYLFVLTHTRGIISKLSIGATDEDFALISTSPAIDGTTDVRSWNWLNPSPSYFFVVCVKPRKIYVFDVDSNRYQATSFPTPANPFGGVVVPQNNTFAISDFKGGILHHYKYTLPGTSTASRPRSRSPSESVSPSRSAPPSPSRSPTTSRSRSASGSSSTSRSHPAAAASSTSFFFLALVLPSIIALLFFFFF